MIKRLIAMIFLLLILTIQPAVCQHEPSLTLMIYLCGSNLETDAGAASADLAEMMAHYPTDGSIRVIVMPSGSKVWHNGVATDETVICELTRNGLNQLHALPQQNMGSPEALTSLLEYGYTHFPAQQYALIMWDHGAGPNVGLCFDERFTAETGMDGLTLDELSQALACSPAAKKKLSWIGFDACLMASAETACSIAPYADYMIASQETEPASGWSYAFLEHISNDSSGAETGRRIIDAYFASLPDSLASLALSCVDLRYAPALCETMDRLFSSLHTRLDETSYPLFADCRVNTKSLGNSTSYEYDLIDLVDLLQVYQTEGIAECGEILALLKQTIIESRSSMPFTNGLSIYYPHYGTEELPEAMVSEEYSAFIADMSALRLGKPLTDWSLTSRPSAELADGVTQVTMELTQAQADMLDSAMLLIIKQMSGDNYQLVYRTDDVILTDDDVLTAAYEDQALFIVDAHGAPVSDALPYFLQEDAVVLSGILTRNTEDILPDENWFLSVDCYFRKDQEGRYRLAEVQEISSSPTMQGKATVHLEDYDTLSIYQGSVIPSYNEDGSLLPPSQWTSGAMVYGWWFELADIPDWSIAFLSQQDSRDRYALIQMKDTQNQIVCSELLPIPNPNIVEIPAEQQTLTDNEYCLIRFTDVLEIKGATPSLRFIFTCENRYNQPISVNVNKLQLNDTLTKCNISGSAVNPGEIKSFEIEVDRDALEQAGICSLEILRACIAVSRSYSDRLFEQPIECRLSVDLSDFIREPMSYESLASVVWNGMEFALLDLTPDKDMTVTCQLRIRNLTDQSVVLNTSYFYLNGLQSRGYFTQHLGTLTLPPGVQCFNELKVDLNGYPTEDYRPESRRCLSEALGMEQLNTLGISVYPESRADQAILTFTLPQPVRLPVDKNMQRADTWPVIYDKDGVTLQIADYTWLPDSIYSASYRYINLFMDNRTNTDITLEIPWDKSEKVSSPAAMVNGQKLKFMNVPVSPAGTKVMDSIWYTVDNDDSIMNSIDMILQITDANGRMDQIQVHIEPSGEANTEGSYCMLDAEQLLITAVPLN